MKREIKFRGQRVDNGELVYGLLIANFDGKYSIQVRNDFDGMEYFTTYQIKTETISEFTGLKDKNGIEIYENDTIKIPDLEFIDLVDNGTSSPDEKYEDGIVEIFFDEGGFCFNHPNTDTPCPIYYDIKQTEIVNEAT